MPINVVCTGCKKRFAVSDKFAGKSGPCPKCKTIINVPAKGEEVVIHAPEDFGPKDSKGRAVLKPIARKETKVSPVLTVGIVLTILVVLVVAWMYRSPGGEDTPIWLLFAGAIALGPPLVWAGYAFLRDDEFEAFQGRELWIRVGACGLAYALIWALAELVTGYGLGLEQLEVMHMVFVAPAMIGVGAFAAYAALDFDFGMGALHYSLYLLTTVVLRLILGLPAM
jgi:hypothetical protein